MLKTHKTVNLETGEETIIEIEETVAEKAEREQSQKELSDRLSALSDKEAKRQSVYEKLGLTADDVAALFD
jgi:predicted DNA-binding antitoxin AbrB/MazE fold protein